MTALSFVIRSVSMLGVAALAAAQTSQVTIRDTVYRADGSPFNGIAIIEWRSFQNPGNVGAQSTTARIVSGALLVRLAPTTNASNGAYYLVRYNSDGQHQFSEVWAVPPATAVLRLRDVRATLLPGGVVVGGGQGGVVIGNNSIGADFIDSETPTGAVNGSNDAFTLSRAPNPPSSLALYRNGLLLTNGFDYSLSGVNITFLAGATPQSGDILEAYFRAASSTSATHALLSTTHADTTPSAPSRGGLIVGQGSSPAWSLLPLGATNRCLTSNGTDAVWNTCLYTAFPAGTVPFTDSAGNLTSNSAAFVWRNTNRRLSVGHNIDRSTLYVFDDRPSAVTELIVRSGAGQGSTPIQFWLQGENPVAWVNQDGGFNVRRVLTNSAVNRPGLSDAGTPADPIAGALVNGDLWHNTTQAAWKGRAGGVTFSEPQIVCGGSLTAGSGTCNIPGALVQSGDRFVVEAHYLRTSGSGTFSFEVRWGSIVLTTGSTSAGENAAAVESRAGLSASAIAWSSLATRASGVTASIGNAALTTGAAATITFTSTVPGGTVVSLQNFTVTRYPAQSQ